MKPLTRWHESGGPEDIDLRAALVDARRGPTNAQVDALARRLAERARAIRPAPATPLARGRTRATLWIAGLCVGVSLLGGGLWTLKDIDTSPRPAASAPREGSTKRGGAPELPKAHMEAPTPAPAPTTATESAHPTVKAAKPRQMRARMSPREQVDPSLDEVSVLQQARRALLAHPSAALALALEHQKRFPQGLFTEERRAIQVEALWRLERVREAEQVWRDFERLFPHSNYRERLARLRPSASGKP